jgi:hypothetical protein
LRRTQYGFYKRQCTDCTPTSYCFRPIHLCIRSQHLFLSLYISLPLLLHPWFQTIVEYRYKENSHSVFDSHNPIRYTDSKHTQTSQRKPERKRYPPNDARRAYLPYCRKKVSSTRTSVHIHAGVPTGTDPYGLTPSSTHSNRFSKFYPFLKK